ncbi:hypothetical protein B0H21DRAFT_739266 [Amylocystis lapponica]|nr:hypothetical protein B0H21DRAFT_739266 [Amylocystis lapponica]
MRTRSACIMWTSARTSLARWDFRSAIRHRPCTPPRRASMPLEIRAIFFANRRSVRSATGWGAVSMLKSCGGGLGEREYTEPTISGLPSWWSTSAMSSARGVWGPCARAGLNSPWAGSSSSPPRAGAASWCSRSNAIMVSVRRFALIPLAFAKRKAGM